MKYLPIIFSIPTALLWIVFIYIQVTGGDTPMGLWLLGLSFLAFTACVAMAFVKPAVKEWRIAAMFTGLPFGLVVLLLIFFALIGYNG